MGENTEGKDRVAVICNSCGRGFAAEKYPDGSVKTIGSREGCHCGSTDFRRVEEPSTESDDTEVES